MAKVLSVCISEKRGTKKVSVPYIELETDYGIIGDAHAGNWHRQVSLLAYESVEKMSGKGVQLFPGDFAENIVTQGITLNSLPVGTVIEIGSATLEVTQIGKKCHNDCEIKKLVGMCVMPTDGIFARVLKGGIITPGDNVTICED